MSQGHNSQSKDGSCLDKMGWLIKKCDLFYVDKFLKYRNDDEHSTYTGAFCSIILIAVFVILFASTALTTINKENVTHSTSLYRPTDPLILGEKEKQNFLLSVGIEGINLLKLPLFFEIQLLFKVSRRGKVIKQSKHNLQPCNKETWSKLSEQAGNIFDELQMSEWLCLPSNLNIELNGTNSAPELTYAQLLVTRCDSTHFACVNDSQFQQFLKTNEFFNLKVYFTNPSISPGQADYLKYYLDDTNHYSFTHKTGVSANLFFSEYTIETEQSIGPEPFSNKKVEKGVFMDSTLDAVNNYPIDSSVLAKVGLRKSINSVMYQRSYRRVDDALSYIGGLFGSLIMLMIVMRKFNEYSFQIQLSSQLFLQKIEEGRFHLANYFVFLFYIVVNFFAGQKYDNSFPLMSKYYKCHEQIEGQLSIDYLLKRIIFLEKVVEMNFDAKKLEGISLHHKMSLETLKNKRQFYDNNKQFKSAVQESAKRMYDKRNDEYSIGRLEDSHEQNKKNQKNNDLEMKKYKITQNAEEKGHLQKGPDEKFRSACQKKQNKVNANISSPDVNDFTIQNKKQVSRSSNKRSKNRKPQEVDYIDP